ncbi:predicted protein [Arabidopsis lyrata subsp. lyrata]|uniref:Predicted protein n=1 Tax=Arabidopsis lyrata subsp. lyrata TaxID=81972 RepID=D7LLS9_ARALL|nr:predicted protein [Arabidopsis lyrata subsp. lyrata]
MIDSVEYNGVDEHGWKKVVSRKQKPEDQAANGNLANNDNSNGAAANENLDYSEEQAGDVVDESNLKAEEEEKPDWKLSLAKAAAKIGPSDLADFLDRVPDTYPLVASFQLVRFLDYYEVALSGVPCPWRQMLQESDLPNLFRYLIFLNLSTKHHSIGVPSTELRCDFVLWSFNYILCDLYIQRGGVFHDEAIPLGYGKPGDPCVSEVSIFVTLAMLVRSDPLVLTRVMPSLWIKRYFHGPGRIPLTIWLVDQASQDNLPVGLYSWVHSLLPLVPRIPESTDPILKLVEKILAKPDAQTILVNAPVWDGRRLIPPHIFEALLWLTFPVTSEREEATSRFEAIYPLLKEVALASTSGNEAIKQIFTFSLKLSGEEVTGNPVLAKEATSIAIWSLTENINCWKHWDNVYKENLGVSVALLKKLVDEWNDHSLKLLSPPSDTLTLSQTMKSFMLKNKKAITEASLYKEADESCKVISGRLPRGRSSLKGTTITAVVLVATVVLAAVAHVLSSNL